jgi:hypothetical protein
MPWSLYILGLPQKFPGSVHPELLNGIFPKSMDLWASEGGTERTPEGKLEITSAGSENGFLFPARTVLTRFMRWSGARTAVIKEIYEVKAELVSTTVPEIPPPAPEPITHVQDLRSKFKGVAIPVTYGLTNENWLPSTDERLKLPSSENE